ncbi:MAG: GNAT family N-acetyltransferase [Pseudomonadota bacterium]
MRLRWIRQSDAPGVFAGWSQDAEVCRFLTWRPHTALSQAQTFVKACIQARAAGTEFNYVLTLRESGELIGDVSARTGEHGVDLGYLLARCHWGQGFMAEAVTALSDWFLNQDDVFRVWAVCDVDNVGSARVLEKSGFAREGTLHRWVMHPAISNAPRDAYCYAKTR